MVPPAIPEPTARLALCTLRVLWVLIPKPTRGIWRVVGPGHTVAYPRLG